MARTERTYSCGLQKDFVTLVEQQLSKSCEEHDISCQDFFQACKRLSDDDDSTTAAFVDIILLATDYAAFVDIMIGRGKREVSEFVQPLNSVGSTK